MPCQTERVTVPIAESDRRIHSFAAFYVSCAGVVFFLENRHHEHVSPAIEVPGGVCLQICPATLANCILAHLHPTLHRFHPLC